LSCTYSAPSTVYPAQPAAYPARPATDSTSLSAYAAYNADCDGSPVACPARPAAYPAHLATYPAHPETYSALLQPPTSMVRDVHKQPPITLARPDKDKKYRVHYDLSNKKYISYQKGA